MSKKNRPIARYESIALDIAQQIAQGQIPLGTRLRGRTTLSSMYRVSPETIRKAMAILEHHHVVQVRHGSGIHVVSSEHAALLLQEYDSHQDLEMVIERIRETIDIQRDLLQEMENALQTVIKLTRRD